MRFTFLVGGALTALLASHASVARARATSTAPHVITVTEVVVGVAEEGSGKPIAGAQVFFPELRRAAYTDWMGEARFPDVPQGTHRVRVRRLGYAPSETQIQVGSRTVGPVFMLERLPPTLDTVEVKAKLTAIDLPLFLMERRRQMGIGRFITDSVLLAHRSDALSFLLQQRLPGLTVYQGTGSTSLVFSSGRNCPVRVYLDDLPLPSGSIGGLPARYQIDLFPIVSPADLAGVEFYQDGMIPPQYRRLESSARLNSAALPCLAVLLLWSRWK